MNDISSLLWINKQKGNIYDFSDSLEKNHMLVDSLVLGQKIEGYRAPISTCEFNPYGNKLITGCDDGCVWIWDVSTRFSTPQVILQPHISGVCTTNFLSSNIFVTGGNDSTVQVVELTQTGAKSRVYNNHHTKGVIGSFVIDQNTFVTCSYDNTIRLFDIRQSYSNTELKDLPMLTQNDIKSNTEAKVFSDMEKNGILPKEKGGGYEKECDSCDESLIVDYRDKSKKILCIDTHPVLRKFFATGGSDGTIAFSDIRALESPSVTKEIGFSIREAYGSEMEVTGVAFDETGKKIAASVLNGNIHVFVTNRKSEIEPWDSSTKINSSTSKEINIGDYVSPDGNIDIDSLKNDIENKSKEEPLTELPTMEAPNCIKVMKGHKSHQTRRNVKWFGNHVVTGSDDGIIYIYNFNSGSVVKVLEGHTSSVTSIAVHQEKRMIASCGFDDFASLWEVSGCTEVDRLSNEMSVKEALEGLSTGEGIPGMSDCSIY